MKGTGYRILGYAVWHGGRWYVRHRLPSTRRVALSTLTFAGGLSAAAAIAKRASA